MSFERYLDAEYKINEGLIRLGLSLEREVTGPKDPAARMAEMESFLGDCGNPERGIPAIHVGGTSGKGSVCAAIAGILTEAGLKVGLHVSPYLQSATEKIWIDDRFISSDEFADLVDWVWPIAKPRVHPNTRASIHGMASVAIAIEGFRRKAVDVMVFEVGCGGRFDLTSFVETSVAVVTNVGMDHVISLGPNLEDIAWHKSGIARSEAPMVTGASGSSLDIIAKEAKHLGSALIPVAPCENALSNNRAVATEAASQFASTAGINLDDDTIARGLERVHMAGRFETMPGNGPKVVIDGAHNAEKLAVASGAALTNIGPGRKVAVLGFLGTKAKPEITLPLKGLFDEVIATEPAVYAKTSCPADETAKLLRGVGYTPHAIPDMNTAVDKAMQMAGKDGTVFISGSFYLVGDLRNRWFKKEDVVMQRTSWPVG